MVDMIAGIGEIGSALRKLLEDSGRKVFGVDIDVSKNFGVQLDEKIAIMNICYPYNNKFENITLSYINNFSPSTTVIHSTIKPHTYDTLYKKIRKITNLIYSPCRGIHTRMLTDLKRYSKFYGCGKDTAVNTFLDCFEQDCHLKIHYLDPLTLEVAKIMVDTSYYGWLIAFGQLVDKVCEKTNVKYDDVWEFASEIQTFLGNRPKTFVNSKGIGGHCVLPNLELIADIVPELKKIITTINKETMERKSVIKSEYAQKTLV